MNPRRKVVRLFGYGIVLPSLLLGYLAFRGIRNDRALVEKQRLEELRRIAEQVVQAVEDGLSSAEAALRKAVVGIPGTLRREDADKLENPALGNPLIEQVFSRRGSGEIVFPPARLLFEPDGSRSLQTSAAAEPGVLSKIREAERLEFSGKSPRQALVAYQAALERSGNPGSAAVVLNAIARVQKKAGRLREARATYERIVRDLGDAVLPGGLPLGPSAALEICALDRDLGDVPAAAREAVETYRSLVRSRWILERSEFELFIQSTRNSLEELLRGPTADLDPAPIRAEFQALGEEERERRAATERMLLFKSSAAPAQREKTGAPPGEEESGPEFLRQAIEAGGGHYLVSMERPPGRSGGRRDEAWGIIVAEGRLIRDVLEPALREPSAAGKMPWVVRGQDGRVLAASGEIPSKIPLLKTVFPAGVPDWTLEFHAPAAGAGQPFFLSRRGFSSVMFLLIAGILAFGLVLTVRSVSHELELARLKSDFVSTVSHEFKSPLTSIRQIAEMLQSGRVPSEERRQRYLDVLLEQSERLSLLTDNILSLARIEEGRQEFRFEKTDIAGLLNEVVSTVRERVRHEGFAVELDVRGPLPPVMADRTSLAQAVSNLLDNAVKYSGDSRTVSVSASAEGNELTIGVKDSGVGIRKQDLDRIFERFYRGGDELTRTVKGSGLGLTLVRKIVEAHGGRIEVVSEPGRGSTFTIRLPAG
jgi:signal transduction histidine kinase